jgi:uncharacterized protein DUF3310
VSITICRCGRGGLGPHVRILTNGCPSREPGFTEAEFDQLRRTASAESDGTVEHPVHYYGPAKCQNCAHPIECIDVTAHMNFNLGNVIKYVWRADRKGQAIEDLEKAAWYLRREIERRKAVQR